MLCPAPITLDPEVPFVDHLRVSVDGEFFAGTVGVESLTAGCVGGRKESSDAAPGEASAGFYLIAAAAADGEERGAAETVALLVGDAVKGRIPAAAARDLSGREALAAAAAAAFPGGDESPGGDLALAVRIGGRDWIVDDEARLGDVLRAAAAPAKFPGRRGDR